AADPRLNHFFCYELHVTISPGDQWKQLDLNLTHVQGQIYFPPAHDSRFAQPALWNQYPYLQFDPFINGANSASPQVLGRADPAGPPGTEIFSSTGFNI